MPPKKAPTPTTRTAARPDASRITVHPAALNSASPSSVRVTVMAAMPLPSTGITAYRSTPRSLWRPAFLVEDSTHQAAAAAFLGGVRPAPPG